MHFKYIILLFLALNTYIYSETPWGKDIDLIDYKPAVKKPEPELSVGKWIASKMILFHQEVISPIDGPRSHFFPSSSEYAKLSIQKHGFFKGVVLGCDRLLRENEDPWVYQTCLAPDGRKLKINLPP